MRANLPGGMLFVLLSCFGTITAASAQPPTPLEAAVMKDKNFYQYACDIRGNPFKNIERILSLGADVNEQDAAGGTALAWAIRLGEAEITRLLLERGANPHLLNEMQYSQINSAIRQTANFGNGDKTPALNLALAARGMPPDTANFYDEFVRDFYALAFAYGIALPEDFTEEKLRADIKHYNPPEEYWRNIRQDYKAYQAGARFLPPSLPQDSIIAPDKDPELITAIKNGDLAGVKRLLDQKHSPNSVSAYYIKDGNITLPQVENIGLYANTALNVAIHMRRDDIAHALLEKGANPNIRGQFVQWREKGDKKAYPSFGLSPLWIAVRRGNTALVKDLLAHNADVNQKSCDYTGSSPLYAAQNTDMAELLIAHGANVNQKTRNRSILESAIDATKPESEAIFTLLLENGADPNQRIGDKPVFFSALSALPKKFAEIMIAHGAEIDLRTSKNNNFSASNPYLERKDINSFLAAQKSRRITEPIGALMQAIDLGDYHYMQKLLVDYLPEYRRDLDSALLRAAAKADKKFWDTEDASAYSDTLRLLIDFGAEAKATDDKGNTVLHYARDEQLIPFLVGSGADVNARNKDGVTPFEAAAIKNLPGKGAALALNKADTTSVAEKYPAFMSAVQSRLDEVKNFRKRVSDLQKPSAGTDGYQKTPENIEYNKQLAVYRAERAVIEAEKAENEKPFDEKKWQDLANSHAKSPCLIDNTQHCLLMQAVKIRAGMGRQIVQQGYSETSQQDKNLIEAVISYGATDIAKILLQLVPQTDVGRRVPLLLTAGQDDVAIKLLRELQETRKLAFDYDAIWALTQRGALDKALDVAREVVPWKYTDPNPPPAGVVRGGFGECPGNIMNAFPRSLAVLGNKFLLKKQYDKVETIIELLKSYEDNGTRKDRTSGCDYKYVKWSYQETAFGLAETLAKDNKKTRATEVFREIIANAKKRYTNPLSIIRKMKKSGIDPNMGDLGVTEVPRRSPDPRNGFYNNDVRGMIDEGALALAFRDRHDDAIARLEALNSPDIRINTFLTIARNGIRDKDLDNTARVLERMSPFLGHRQLPMDNVRDYVYYADMLFSMGKAEESRKALDTAIALYLPMPKKQYERFAAADTVTLLFVKLGDLEGMQNWVNSNEIEYSSDHGYTFSKILDYYAQREEWTKFDDFRAKYTPLYKRNGSYKKESPFHIADELATTLASKNQLERYMMLSSTMDQSPHQEYQLRSLLRKALDKNITVPTEMLTDLWNRNTATCKNSKQPTAERKMIDCYLQLAPGLMYTNPFESDRDRFMENGY